MSDDQREDFYKDQYFTALAKRLDTIESKLDDIQSKVIYMYGFAAAIGIVASIIIDYVRTHLFNVAH